MTSGSMNADGPVPPVRARRMRLFPPAVAAGCTDPPRHELYCPPSHRQGGIMVAWRAEDGCTGRMCPACDQQYGVRRWPGLAERIPGPVRGLDALDTLRAFHEGEEGR